MVNGFPPRGSVGVGLCVLEGLKSDWNLDADSHIAPGGAQVRGASKNVLDRILTAHGESRSFLAEGGRTNRGSPAAARSLLSTLSELGLDALSPPERESLLNEAQKVLVKKIQDQLNSKRIEVAYDPSKTLWEAVHGLLTAARAANKAPAVAQHIVGAKLALRFPRKDIENNPTSAADASGRRLGDFLVGDTVFHVTLSPGQPLMQKCRRNIAEGHRPFILVPHDRYEGARQLAEDAAPGQIEVESIESFVSQNIGELSEFEDESLKTTLRSLLESYNSRVEAAETDRSVMVDIPGPLRDRRTVAAPQRRAT